FLVTATSSAALYPLSLHDALPILVMTDQLVALAQDDVELLAILAHEVGHHEHRHGLRRALEKSAVLVVMGFLFGDVSGTGALSVDRKSTRLNSSHVKISYAVFCLK